MTRKVIPFVFQKAAFVLNASRRFRYTLDLKKEEERKQILRKIIVHIRAIQVWFLQLTLFIHLQSIIVHVLLVS
jgi:hypothetical protein